MVSIVQNGDHRIWRYQMEKPMSSYLLVLAIGHFNMEKSTTTSGIPLEYYYENEDTVRVEPTYRDSKQLFDFLEKKI